MAMATVRWGITDGLTVEGHAEASAGVAMAGAGSAGRLGAFGAASADVAVSDGRSGPGGLVSTSAQASFGPVSLFGGASVTAGHFEDVAAAEGAPTPQARY